MERITSASAAALLERAGPAIASGSVNLISVEAIRARSQERWARTRGQVEEFVERTFARHATARDVIVSVNDLEYLTIQPDASRAAALNVSANVLRETLGFFLGKADPSDLKLLLVTGFKDGEIAVDAVDASGVSTPDAPRRLVSLGACAAPAEPLDWRMQTRSCQLVSDGVRDYGLTLSLEPVWNVGQKVVTSFRLRDCVTLYERAGGRSYSRGRLPAAVAGLAALQSIAYAAELLSGGDAGLKVALHAPVLLDALSLSSARYSLLHALKRVEPDVRRRLILEIVNLPPGFPQSRMTELVAALTPYCRAVLARAPNETDKPYAWRRCGLGGVTLDCGHIKPQDRSALIRLKAFATAARSVAPACVAYALSSRSLLMSAWAAGFTHVGGAAVEAEIRTPLAQRFDASQLYASMVAGDAA